tara:strand:- start:406 stop:558 length:153 start_codon:yes stop_codon:yes gene_type:complete
MGYGIEKHAGRVRDVGVIIEHYRFKDEAIREAKIFRQRDKEHGYRVVKLR